MSLRLDTCKQFKDVETWLKSKCTNEPENVDCPACNVLDYIGQLHCMIERADADFKDITSRLASLSEMAKDLST